VASSPRSVNLVTQKRYQASHRSAGATTGSVVNTAMCNAIADAINTILNVRFIAIRQFLLSNAL